jgi:hypothetical protein
LNNEDRLKIKPSKQDVEKSIERLNVLEEKTRTNSNECDILFANCHHAIINTELLSRDEAVDKIMGLVVKRI